MTLLELMLALNKHYPDGRMLMAINPKTGKPLPIRQAPLWVIAPALV